MFGFFHPDGLGFLKPNKKLILENRIERFSEKMKALKITVSGGKVIRFQLILLVFICFDRILRIWIFGWNLEVTFFSTLNEVVNKNSLVLCFVSNLVLEVSYVTSDCQKDVDDFAVGDFKKTVIFTLFSFFFLNIQKKKAVSSLKRNIIFKLSVFF